MNVFVSFVILRLVVSCGAMSDGVQIAYSEDGNGTDLLPSP